MHAVRTAAIRSASFPSISRIHLAWIDNSLGKRCVVCRSTVFTLVYCAARAWTLVTTSHTLLPIPCMGQCKKNSVACGQWSLLYRGATRAPSCRPSRTKLFHPLPVAKVLTARWRIAAARLWLGCNALTFGFSETFDFMHLSYLVALSVSTPMVQKACF